MKNISRVFIILLLIFSFYYTNKIIDFLKQQDPIMQEIKNKSDKYKIDAKDAKISDNSIISGRKGKEVDYNKTYSKMKQYGFYNETLTVLKEVKPNVSIDDNYDKYIVGGNKEKREVSLVFTVLKDTNINNILNILEKNKVAATFFIDGTYLENNISLLKSMKNHEIEILSYNNSYDSSLFKTSISYLENITNSKVKYCYTRDDNNKLLKLCSKNNLHTIKPSVYIKNNLYKNIKNNLDNSLIISLEINNYIEKELSSSIDYIKNKGYDIVVISELLSENY